MIYLPEVISDGDVVEVGLKLEVREPNVEDTTRSLIMGQGKNVENYLQKALIDHLSEEETCLLLRRLPNVKAEHDDQKDFFMRFVQLDLMLLISFDSIREKSLKPPLAAEINNVAFPPEIKLEKPKELIEEETKILGSDLSVIRYSPEGVLDRSVPSITITFSQPMVPVSGINEVESQVVPIEISPLPKKGGKFKWLGTKTLVYEANYRFDMSTKYHVTVKQGTKSQVGGILKEALTFTFETPRLHCQDFLPSNNSIHPLNEVPIYYAEFDQEINPSQVVKFITINGKSTTLIHDGTSSNPLLKEHIEKILKEYELERRALHIYHSYKTKLEHAPEARHLWFTINSNMTSSAMLIIKSGVVGAEGPLPTETDSTNTINNYPHFTQISKSGGEIPMQAFNLAFSTSIDTEKLTENMVTVSPPIERMVLNPYGSNLSISGKIKGRTTYKVFLKNIEDVWGQKLANTTVEFSVRSARQSLQSFKTGMIVLDPTLNPTPTFPIVTVNLDSVHCQVYQVKPSMYNYTVLGFNAYSPNQYPGKLVFDGIISTKGEIDEPLDTEINLQSYLQHPSENVGQLLVIVEPEKASWKGDWNQRPGHTAWIQATKIAVDCIFDSNSSDIYYWVNSLLDGKIIKENVTFQLNNSSPSKPNPSTGVGSQKNVDNSNNLKMIAVKGNDTCFIPDAYHYRNYYQTQYISHIFNDRGLYKPGEIVSIKGYVRELIEEENVLKIQIPSIGSSYTIFDARYQKYESGTLNLSQDGTFNVQFKVPDNANLGNHSISFDSFSANHSFQVQEFRTPEFKSKSVIPAGNYVVGGSAICTTNADYYSGGGISGAKCTYTIQQTNSSYIPPNQSSYHFGGDCFAYGQQSSIGATSFEGITDSTGEHQIAIAFEESERVKKSPVTISVEATVQDINRQTISSSTSFLVHPCKYYCGIKLSKQFAKPNIPVIVSLVVTDIDGHLVPGISIRLKAQTSISVKKGYKYVSQSVEILDEVLISETEALDVPVKFEKSGNYNFSVEIVDSETGQTNTSSTSLYITGVSSREEKLGVNLLKKQLILLPDKTEYQIGDTAKILIQSPFESRCEGVLVSALQGIINQNAIQIDPEPGYTELELEITPDFIPNIQIHAEVTSCESRVDAIGNVLDLPKQPAFASGSCNIKVSKLSKTLVVQSKPESEYLTPGTETSIDVLVKDPISGNMVEGSEVCIIAVDEAVLSLTGHSISNPLDTFIREYQTNCQSNSIRNYVFVKSYENIVFQEEVSARGGKGFRFRKCSAVSNSCYPDNSFIYPCCEECCNECMCCCSCEGGAIGGENVEQPKITVRSNFNPLAIFSPSTKTNSKGLATVKFKLPDNLTKYRITAVALKGDCNFGIHESSIVAQLPLSIRPSLPRFLNFGDRAEFTCVLQNQTQLSLEVNAAINFTNLSLLDTSKKGLKIRIPALGRAELRFPMSTDRVGIARFQVGVSIANSGINFSDAIEKEIRVFTPATTEAFATYGEMDGDSSVFQPVRAPHDVFPQFGGLKITTSSTALSSLTDSFLYLYNYPFECCEQISSRLLSIFALKDILLAFKLGDIPSKESIDNNIKDALSKLVSRQYPGGGYGYWSYYGDYKISPYVTCHVGHAFARAKVAGYAMNESTLSKLISVLRTIESYCVGYSEESIKSIKAYAYYTLALLGDSLAKDLAETLYRKHKLKGNFEHLAWLATAMYLSNSKRATTSVNEIIEHLNKHVNETAQTANFITSYGDAMATKHVMLHSDRRTDGICLEALITISPQNYLIPKLVKGLLAHKKKGRWNNTQENVFILLSLNTYFNVFESITPDFVANIWLGENYCGEQTFKGRSKDENQLAIPMNLLENEEKTLAFSKTGPGRLYYRIGMDYAPKNLTVDALDYGFEIQRRYEHVTDASHVKYDTEKKCWRFKAGELIRIKLRLTNTSRRYHVALVDFLPAGLEAINPELKGTPSISDVSGTDSSHSHSSPWWCWWNPIWYEHHNIRDERVEAFSSLLWEGTHEFTYLARATSIGSFVIPGVKAEEMYTPEIFGRSATEFAEVYE